jgi:hypothetical protein
MRTRFTKSGKGLTVQNPHPSAIRPKVQFAAGIVAIGALALLVGAAQTGSAQSAIQDRSGGSSAIQGLGPAWTVDGNSQTNWPLPYFVGTLWLYPLEFRTNNIIGMRIVPGGTTGTLIPNVIGGAAANAVVGGAQGGTIGGGTLNLVGSLAAVGGGASNQGTGSYSTVIGGRLNIASNVYAVTLGGLDNQATQPLAYAAGRSARALHQGSFVWADSTGPSFASTTPNQFLVRAARGVGINTNAPGTASLSVNGNGFDPAIYAVSNGSNAIYSVASSATGQGIFATAPGGTTSKGVHGWSAGSAGVGVYGNASHPSGAVTGVYGLTGSTSGVGVFGNAQAAKGATRGVHGIVNSQNGTGVRGSTPGTTTGWGGYFEGRGYFRNNVGIGTTSPATALHVFKSSPGALKVVDGTQGLNRVLTDVTGNGDAQWVVAQSGFQLPFTGFASTSAPGNFNNSVFEVDSTGGNSFSAIVGRTNSSSGGPFGDAGVMGITTGQLTAGVIGKSFSGASIGYGVIGYASNVNGGTGVLGQTASNNGYGVVGTCGTGGQNQWGVFANGQIGATGLKPFRIDHPFDPENRYLMHYSAEGPEPQNVYNGNVRTDLRGHAWVQLPHYFSEINIEPRYQLTVVDDSASEGFVLVKVGRKIQDNRFLIMTNAPSVEVSWQVTARRNDRYVRAYGAPIELMKPAHEVGTYQRPELYGKPESMGLFFSGSRATTNSAQRRP